MTAEKVIHDPLTGLYNRRHLYDMFDREITRAERKNEPVSVIIADIDHFKHFNDTYGHLKGDQILIEISRMIEKHMRTSDIICRLGGEEFVMVLPETTLESAQKRAEEIRQMCAQFILQDEQKALPVTLSFGVAAYPAHGETVDQLLIKADKAMYQSKDKGRNCVTVWQEY